MKKILEAKNIVKTYNRNTKNEFEVLHGISLEVYEGDFICIMGPSGSGKSTIAKLIASYWDIDEGTITIGGVDIKKIPADQVMDLIGYVSQDNFLFNVSVRENIRMGNPNASDQEVEEIAKAAGCHEFIMGLEHGLRNPCGRSRKPFVRWRTPEDCHCQSYDEKRTRRYPRRSDFLY